MAKKILLRRPVKVPSELSHFTSVAGLLGIVNSGAIWASNISFLNDKRELHHGIDAAAKVLMEFAKGRSRKRRELITATIENLRRTKLPDTYAACFCRRRDLLSQWRGYSGRQQGVSITFSGTKLAGLFRKYHGTPMEVVYDKERTVARVRKALSVVMAELDDLFGEFDEEEPEKLGAALIQRMSRLVPRFKDDGFAEEDEWRFVIQRQSDFADVDFRDADGVLVPYLTICSPEGELLPITHVTVGPGKNQELTIRSIELVLQSKGYSDIEVTASVVPYRT